MDIEEDTIWYSKIGLHNGAWHSYLSGVLVGSPPNETWKGRDVEGLEKPGCVS